MPISYRRVLLSPLLYATVYIFTQFAECTCIDCKLNGITKEIVNLIIYQNSENHSGRIWHQAPLPCRKILPSMAVDLNTTLPNSEMQEM
jgi:hypothetical protein